MKTSPALPGSLHDPAVLSTLDQAHRNAKGDYRSFIAALPRVIGGLLRGKGLMASVSPAMLRKAYIPVSRTQGQLLYTLARAAHSRSMVEFGSSFGISTLYLAAAARDNGGRLTTTEIIPEKCRATEQNLQSAGLSGVCTVLEGDALRTLCGYGEEIDLLFLDGWKDLYTGVLDLLRPQLRAGALVIADNVNLADARNYLRMVQKQDSGFFTVILNKSTALSVLSH